MIQVIDCRKTVLLRFGEKEADSFTPKLLDLIAKHGHPARVGELSFPKSLRRAVRGQVTLVRKEVATGKTPKPTVACVHYPRRKSVCPACAAGVPVTLLTRQ